jgi:hypothetical protein
MDLSNSQLDFSTINPLIPQKIFDKYNEVNRLIIIGNGFDLAHGLKSSFKDFIYNYCYKVLSQFLTNMHYEDFFISIHSKIHISDGIEFISKMEPQNAFEKFITLHTNSYIQLDWKKPFFSSIFKDVQNKNWVDIEIKYFDHLKEIKNTNNQTSIDELNAEFEFIKTEFLNYLQGEVVKNNVIPKNELLTQFRQTIKSRETQPNTIKGNKTPEKICILNFNYTNIAETYSKELNLKKTTYIPIHGQLLGDDNKVQAPVFGFGDEVDPDYEQFELLRNDNLFTHIKSFKYLQFNHYRNLLQFIEDNPYQIQIFGHSCGISDRTLLKTIFEHENCISIKPYYFESEGSNDYVPKSYSIYRHFKSKSELRNKVVNAKYCEPMFQPQK